jgi:hypothetical protein
LKGGDYQQFWLFEEVPDEVIDMILQFTIGGGPLMLGE